MKRTSFFWALVVFILSTSQLGAQCSYTLTLLDTFGDGWNGNSIAVTTTAGGTLSFTLTSGSSTTYQLSSSTGDTLSFGWQGGGSYPEECSFTVTDNSIGTVLYTSPSGDLMSTSIAQFSKTCLLTSASTPCLFSSPYKEAFSGNSGGWIAPTSQFNRGSINGCWDRDDYTTYNWIKAPSPSSSLANATGPNADHTNGGQGYLSCDPYFFASIADSASLITPYISLANDTAPQVSFWYHLFGNDIKRLEVSVTTDTSGSWTVIDSLFPNTGAFVTSNSPWHQAIYPISSFIGDTVSFKFTAFRDLTGFNQGQNSRISIDDFEVSEDTLSCDKPIKLRLSNLALSTAFIQWDANSASTYQIQYAVGTSAPSGGTTAVVSNNQYTLTSLTPNSDYTFRVRSICGTSDTSAWSEYITIETQCGFFSAPWSEDFENSSWVAPQSWFDQGTFNDCFLDSGSLGFYWKVAQGPKSSNEGPSTDHTPTGSGKFLATNYRYGNTAPNQLSFTTPWLTVNALSNPELKFWLHAYSNAQPAGGSPVQFGTFSATLEKINAGKTVVFDTSGALQNSQTDSWKEVVIPLNLNQNDTIRITFSYVPKTLVSGQPFSIDDISIDSGPTCSRPRFLKAMNVSKTDAVLNWSGNSSATYEIRYRESGTIAWSAMTSSSNSVTLTGLTPNTKYDWQVRKYCSSMDQSPWVPGMYFFTACSVFQAPYGNNFSSNQWQAPTSLFLSGQIGNCFTRFETNTKGYFWTGARSGFDHYAFTGPNTDHTGGNSGYLFARANSSVSDTARIEFPPVALGQLQSPEFSFWYHMFGSAIGGLDVYARTPSSNDTLLASISGSQQGNSSSAWTKSALSLNDFTGDTVIITMKARKTPGSLFFPLSAAVCIDDVLYQGTGSCAAPTGLTATNITANSVELDWTGGSSISVLEYGPAGFNLGTGQTVTPVSSPYLLTGLASNTAYTFYIKDKCGQNLFSTNDTLSNIVTLCGSVQSQFSISSSGQSVTLDASSSLGDGLAFVWDFGDGTSGIGGNTTHTYSLPGTYTITLAITDACGNSDTSQSTLTVCTSVAPSFSATSSGSTSFNFTAQPIGLSSYSWDFGDGTGATGATTSHTYSSIGTFPVTLTCSDSCGGLYTITDTISTCPALNANFTFNIISSGANGMLVSFFATVTGNQGLIWDWGDGTQSSTLAASISHQYPTVSLNYTITLKAFNECGDTITVVRTLNEVGVNEDMLSDIQIYPNPSSNASVKIEFSQTNSGSFKLFDPSGRYIRSGRFNNQSSVDLPVQELAPGTYVLRISTLRGTFSELLFKL